MIKYFVFALLFIARLSFQPSYAQQYTTPFTSPVISTNTAKIISINASVSGNKITLDWKVSENQSANLFEVEKSTDGKNFTMAALVFGTDKAETGSYQFFEKTGSSPIIVYRIKLVNKDKSAEYSNAVQVNPIQ